jgi:hypothetical protein
MRIKVLLLALSVCFAGACSAQSFFKPIPKLNHEVSLGIATDSIQNSLRPVASVTASFSSGAALAGGFGIAFQHNKWDIPSSSWVTQWSASALGFLVTNGNSVGGIAGVVLGIPGTNGLINIGPGYDFTNKQWGFLSGVIFKFN